MSILTSVKVMKTIWPFAEGYGVVISHPFKRDTICCHGLSKEDAEEHAKTVKKDLKS